MEQLVPGVALATLGLSGAVALWALRPLRGAAEARQAPSQTTLVDFFSLFAMIQLCIAVVHTVASEDASRGDIVTAYGVVCVLCGILWVSTVQRLSRAGVRSAWRRFAITVFVVPVSMIGAVALPALTVALMNMSLGRFRHDRWPHAEVWVASIGLGLFSAMCVAGLCCRRLVAAEPPAGRAEEPPGRP